MSTLRQPAAQPMSALNATFSRTPDQSQGFTVGCREHELYYRRQYLDPLSFYQNRYRIFAVSTIQRNGKFKVKRPQGFDLMWQPFNSCDAIPVQGGKFESSTMEGCRIQLFARFCYDEFLNSCFEGGVRYNNDGSIDIDNEAEAILNDHLSEFYANAHKSLRYLMALGKMYEGNMDFEDNIPQDLKDYFPMMTNACTGWATKWYNDSKQYPWLDVEGAIDGDKFDDTGCYTGKFSDIIKTLIKEACPEMKTLFRTGGAGYSFAGGNIRPLILASDSMIQVLWDEWEQEKSSLLTNGRCVTREDVEGGGWIYNVYGVPVIPLSELTGYDKYIKGDQHFVGITTSENIQLGASFTGITGNLEDRNIGLVFKQNLDPSSDHYLKWGMRSHAVVANTISDRCYAVGTFYRHTVDK